MPWPRGAAAGPWPSCPSRPTSPWQEGFVSRMLILPQLGFNHVQVLDVGRNEMSPLHAVTAVRGKRPRGAFGLRVNSDRKSEGKKRPWPKAKRNVLLIFKHPHDIPWPLLVHSSHLPPWGACVGLRCCRWGPWYPSSWVGSLPSPIPQKTPVRLNPFIFMWILNLFTE